MAEEIQEAVQIIRVAYDGIEIAMKVGSGAAARCVSTGDKIIIMAYGQYDPEEAKNHKPSVVFVDEKNKISRISCYEKHGQLG